MSFPPRLPVPEESVSATRHRRPCHVNTPGLAAPTFDVGRNVVELLVGDSSPAIQPDHTVMQLLLVALLLILIVGALSAWLYRGLVMSLVVRLLASRLPNAAKRHGLKIDLGKHEGGWIRIALQADLEKTLSQVLGYPVEASAYSRFGGFNLSRRYSDFLNPDSPYYQCWLGAYVVFDGEHRQAFGFNERGEFVAEEVLAVLEADQRLVYRSAGCPHRFPDGSTVRLTGQLRGERREADGLSWWRVWGEASTWSAYHRGTASQASRLRSRIYGVVPSSASHEVEEFHPLRYEGEFWMRHFPEYGATCAMFYVHPCYTDRSGTEVSKSEEIVPACRELLKGISFSLS